MNKKTNEKTFDGHSTIWVREKHSVEKLLVLQYGGPFFETKRRCHTFESFEGEYSFTNKSGSWKKFW